MRILSSISLILLLLSCQAPSNKNKSISGKAFGTTYTVLYNGMAEEEVLRQGVDSVIHVFNKSVSTYDPESLISKFNAGDTTIVVDAIFKEVFFMSRLVHENTLGYFDPSIGVLRNAYGFGEVAAIENIDQHILDSLMQMVGFDKLNFKEDYTIGKAHPNIYLDFNAIAKGYGVDRIAAYLESKGVDNYLVEISGELYAKGRNLERGQAWSVGIEAVDSDLEDRSYTHSIALENAGLASSGNYRKFRIDPITGEQFVHTINPLTGSAERSNVTSATVIAETCAFADAYATAFMALGLEQSIAVLESLEGIDAYLTYIGEDGKENVYATPGMKLRMKR